jgi:hypothetical protein
VMPLKLFSSKQRPNQHGYGYIDSILILDELYAKSDVLSVDALSSLFKDSD